MRACIEREQRVKGLRERFAAADQSVRDAGAGDRWRCARRSARPSSSAMPPQARIQAAHRDMRTCAGASKRGGPAFEEVRCAASASRPSRRKSTIETRAHAVSLVARARRTKRPRTRWHGWTIRGSELEAEREERREGRAPRAPTRQARQLELRDSLIRLESRRAAQASMDAALGRMHEQRTQLRSAARELEATLASARCADRGSSSAACRITWRGAWRWNPSWPTRGARSKTATTRCARSTSGASRAQRA